MSADVKFDNIWVKFGSFVAARDVNIHIQEGEFYTILGPTIWPALDPTGGRPH
jgi:ABC-type Fe3+/spermidine/putrescine transport system ATPase subunit